MPNSRFSAPAPQPPAPFNPLPPSSHILHYSSILPPPCEGPWEQYVQEGDHRFSQLIDSIAAEYYRVREEVRRLELERRQLQLVECQRFGKGTDKAPESPSLPRESDFSLRPHTTLDNRENGSTVSKKVVKFDEALDPATQEDDHTSVQHSPGRNAHELHGADNGDYANANTSSTVYSAIPRESHSPSAKKKKTLRQKSLDLRKSSHMKKEQETLKVTGNKNPRISSAIILLNESEDGFAMRALTSKGAYSDKSLAVRLVLAPQFDFFFAGLIIFDGILIGLNAQDTLHPFLQHRSLVRVIEDVLKLLFLGELCVRFVAFGVIHALRSSWTRFDAMLVVFSLMDFILLRIVRLDQGADTQVKTLKLLRIFRLARLARAARLLYLFRTLWLLVSGLKASAMTILWAFVMIIVLMYIFAVIGMEIVIPATWDGSYTGTLAYADQVAVNHFGDLPSAMLTLFQVLTFDSIGVIYRPLIYDAESNMQGFLVAAYMSLFMFLVSIALMNLVTAIMVEGSLQQANADKEYTRIAEERRKEELRPLLRQMFAALDTDGSDEVSIEEMDNAPEELIFTLQDMTSVEDVSELFYLVDEDDSGLVNIDEFLDGVLKASAAGDTLMRLQLARVVRQCSRMKAMLEGSNTML